MASPDVAEDRRITFRILCAAGAGACRLQRIGHPRQRPGRADDEGRERRLGGDVGPLEPGAYRYNFNVDGVTVIDPRNPSTSESNTNVWSLVVVPGSDVHGHEERAARRGRRGHLLLDGARAVPPHARLHAAGLRDGQATSIRSSTCCTAPATATTRGPRSAAPASSSTT